MYKRSKSVTKFSYPNYSPKNGYLTEKIRQKYINIAVSNKVLPENAHRMRQIVSLSASNDITKPIQFWQLYSVLGQDRIVNIVRNFYERVFDDEKWFSSVFTRIAGISHHIDTQAGMWLDVMGGGLAYNGGEYRLSFHHTHNAIQLMNDKGAQRWVKLMVETLADSTNNMTEDTRVRLSINTFLTYFISKFAIEFQFSDCGMFGDTNPPVMRNINFLNMTSDAIEALTESELKEALTGRGVDVTKYRDKKELVNKALRL
jgi:truncated hemoglobin YjbI